MDISVRNEGTIVLLDGITTQGDVWLLDHLDPEVQRWGRGFVVEPRYLADILTGAQHDGLTVEVAS